MSAGAFLADAFALLNKIPEPVQTAAIDLAKTVWRSLADGDDPAETARKAAEELAKLENVQRVYHARAAEKFPDYKP